MWDGVEWREMGRSKLAESEALPTSLITALLGFYVPGRRGCLLSSPNKDSQSVCSSSPVWQHRATDM